MFGSLFLLFFVITTEIQQPTPEDVGLTRSCMGQLGDRDSSVGALDDGYCKQLRGSSKKEISSVE